MAYRSGRVGHCFWSCVIGGVNDADVAEFVKGIERIGESKLPAVTVLDIAYGISRPKPLHRKQLTDAVQALPNKERILGHAVVANSPVARGVLTIVNWFVKPVFPEKVFKDPKSALAWLAELDPSIVPARVLEDLNQRVAGFENFRW